MLKKLKKTLFTLNINPTPEVTMLTNPFLLRFAEKIGAEFKIITERKFPDHPVPYEKFQIYELGANNDWNYFIDSECLVHPDMFDFAEVLPENVVLNFNADFASSRFRYDNYFRRDGRNIGSFSFLTISSSVCHDIWKPLGDMTIKEALNNINFLRHEEAAGQIKGFNIDDYVISRNIAKYGLKFKTFIELLNETGRAGEEYFYYDLLVPKADKAKKIKEKLNYWRYIINNKT